ncbi:c6 zinc finger [Fusarium beomiforme]|uniref:C6 zinc finger n=1 Tax=Fusarium beomiforme TaxID=44412 RepID=A0A9P5A3C6_9HYPO|nr:c6 zinc finger [Fusarium beomiforme]
MSGRVIRRRNVKTRNRNGCVTCRARRLKCDETKPECNNCVRLCIPCGGYASQIVFKDQNKLFNHASPRRTRSNQTLREPEDDLDDASQTQEAQDQAPEYDAPYVTPAPELENDAIEPPSPIYDTSRPDTSSNDATEFPVSDTATAWDSGFIPHAAVDDRAPANDLRDDLPYIVSPVAASVQTPHSNFPFFGPLHISSPQTAPQRHITTPRSSHFNNPYTAPIIPQGLLESMKFPEDMLYYHHLRDPSAYGVLTLLYLNDIMDAGFLSASFYHAALALSALKVSKSNVGQQLQSQAAIHALEHFVIALGDVGNIPTEDMNPDMPTPGNEHGPGRREKIVSWLSTVLLLAHFELRRAQMRLWCVHGHAAVEFLSSHLSLVRETTIGESLVSAFSRIAALLEIYARTHSNQEQIVSSGASKSLAQFLAGSTLPYDRLLYIMPQVNELEEEWRSNLRPDAQWDQRVENLRLELEQWRASLLPEDIPDFDGEGPEADLDMKPLTLLSSPEPVRPATSFTHYLVSKLRLDLMYSPESGPKLSPPERSAILRKICRLAAGLPYDLSLIVNNYGYGMLPAMLNAYHMSDETTANWIKKWIASRPDTREGIWDIERVQRLVAYLDKEYNNEGSRSGWTVIKTRMVDAEENRDDPQPSRRPGQSRSFCVEIFCKGKRGWSIDFVEIE